LICSKTSMLIVFPAIRFCFQGKAENQLPIGGQYCRNVILNPFVRGVNMPECHWGQYGRNGGQHAPE